MKTIFKREFVIEQHRKKKTRSEILKMGKDLNLNAMFIISQVSIKRGMATKFA